jgi:hypothetical protein
MQMKNYLIIPALTLILFSACKEKNSSKDEVPISAISIIKGQLNKLDSSIYEFTKLERNDIKTDTTYLKREEVRKFAEPFLALPEIATKNYNKKYDETRLINAEDETLSITSIPKPANENAEIQKQMIIIGLADIANGNVKSIYIDRYIPSKDSTIEQKLFWEIDKYFSIGTIVQKTNQPDKTSFTKIAWQ